MSAEPPSGSAIWRAPAPGRVRGASLLRRLDPLGGADVALEGGFNPLQETGALATLMLIVATVSGVLLLVWYTPSVHQAHASVVAMGAVAAWVRAVHRYSSDATMLFTIVHALRLLAAGRLTGARWLGWVTGVVLIGSLWLVGWTGYWLLWDARGHLVALGTARLLDALPVFTDPLARAFLTDEGVATLLFFVVFFIHMLVPPAMAAGLWLHIQRLSRARYLPGRWPSVAALGLLAVVSALLPVDLAEPAAMLRIPRAVDADLWYLAPLALTERLGPGALWGLVALGGGTMLFPWILAKRRTPPTPVDVPARVHPEPAPAGPPLAPPVGQAAAVTLGRCDGCTTCATDCPYEAIRMVPRTDGRGYDVQAQVDPDLCVRCGICAGSCNAAGIGLQEWPVFEMRRVLDGWLREDRGAKIALLCREALAGAGDVVPDADGRVAGLPGWRVMLVPCAGHVHALTVERAARHGAAEILVGTCSPDACPHREGAHHTHARLLGGRKPALRADHLVGPTGVAPRLRVETVRSRRDVGRAPVRRLGAQGALTAVALALTGLSVLGSDLPLRFPRSEAPELVVTFKHPGQAGERCHDVTEAEKAKLPAHMRRDRVCERARAEVRLRVTVDGTPVVERTYLPSGLWSDGPAVAIETLSATPGEHEVAVTLTDDLDGTSVFRDARMVRFVAGERWVLRFDRTDGFVWTGGS